MRCFKLFGILLFLAQSTSFAGVLGGTGDESTLKKEFSTEYPHALQVLEARYGRARGLVSALTQRRAGSPEQQVGERRFRFAVKRPHMALLVNEAGASRTSASGRSVADSESIICYNHEDSFRLKKAADRGGYAIKFLERNDELKPPATNKDMVYTLWTYLGSPYSLGNFPLRSLMKKKDFTITRFSRPVGTNTRLIRIDFKTSDREGWFVVSPTQGWVLREYEFKMKKSGIRHFGHVEYGELVDGVPLITCVVHNRQEDKGKAPFRIDRFDFKEFSFAEVPDSEFSLTAFGLPSFEDKRGHTLTSHTSIWLFGAAITSLGIAIALRYRLSKHGSRSPA
jgi:hypothetical protein